MSLPSFSFPPWLVIGGSFFYGLIIGSFLNVVIHRVPRGESIVSPRSHCPACGHPIAWYENIPLASYLVLGRRCRACKASISPRYFAVELLTGLIFAGLAAAFGFQWALAKYAVFAAMMIALMFIDLNKRLLPDAITLPGMAAGLIFAFLLPVSDGTAALLARWWPSLFEFPRLVSVLDALLGAIAGAGLLWIVAEVYWRVRHQEGLGFGDVKLMAMVGIFLGVKLALLTIFLGSAVGSIIGGSFMWLQGKDPRYELPFGTFLGLTALFSAVWGKEIVTWYLSLGF